MSTVKIKTEPASTAAAAVDVQVKLEPSLSTGDIKLDQHSSDIGTKAESDSEDYIKSESDDDDDDSDEDIGQNQAAGAPSNQRQFICKHPGCGRRFNFPTILRLHQHEHRLQTELNILGKTFILTRESLDDLWPCPVPECTSTTKTVNGVRQHIRKTHYSNMKEKQQQQPPAKKIRLNHYFLDVDDFYVSGTRCGYHTTTGVFICHECRLVPEYLLTHLQQKHAFDEKSIDNSILPDSAVNASADPNVNQHTDNSHLASVISQPYKQHYQDIIQGWVCVTSGCGYCGYTDSNKSAHKKYAHQGERLTIVPALVLCLEYAKSKASYFLITRIDQAIGAVTTKESRVSQNKLDYSNNGLNTQDESEDDDDVDQNETADASNPKQQWKCEYPYCERFFSSTDQLYKYRREHKLEVVIGVQGMTYTLIRHSVDDRWPCPVPDCELTYKTINVVYDHILNAHCASLKHKRVNSDGSDIQQQSTIKRRQPTIPYLNVDEFYVTATRCGYHATTGLFICHECRLVPECLLTHLQQKHAFNEKSIETEILPESVRVTGSDPNINQHTSNPHIGSAIHEPNQPQHPDIVRGWLCVTSGCGYCGYTKEYGYQHHYKEHRGKQMSTVPALVLRLYYRSTHASCFLITRLDTTTDGTVDSSNTASQHRAECDGEEDDGDELVLSDYGSDEDDIH